ncbi:signal peptidase I [Acholeplasma oculi]|uniref:Peptidase S24/S26A/S26B n=1 Tax=Acholeplasma oculi TaxID=35623 RepID=A0A061AIC5_9MOLU|nr:S24/S26 family peptidase [Acholeplasma oculi]CDR31371.1 Peptidase S24/S26A/S26B [Acholeplasma oculi]SKC39474.1 signal peptidase I [Acholeplasma oculi]SUT91796.1 signal peptidase I [Acholeplasma oculi]
MKQVTLKNDAFMALIIEHLNLGQEVSFIVKGTSMMPFFKNMRTEVIVKKFSSYKKNDVVLFTFEGKELLHRIIKIDQDQVTLRGDGSYQKEVILMHEIHGKVIRFKTRGKKIWAYGFKHRLWNILYFMRPVLLKLVRK